MTSKLSLEHTNKLFRYMKDGSSVEEFNSSLRQSVIDAGPGTRNGVVAAVMSLANQLLEYNVRLPYISSITGTGYGKYNGYGLNPDWGSNGKWHSDYYNFD